MLEILIFNSLIVLTIEKQTVTQDGTLKFGSKFGTESDWF